MRVLVVSPYFPPRADSESFCGGKFAQALLDAGSDTIVMCAHSAPPTHRFDMSARWHSLNHITVDVGNPETTAFVTRCRRAARYRTTEWTGLTAAFVSTAHELHREKRFDVVVSRSSPWYAHLAGYWIASSLRLPWVANFNDPWDMTPFVDDGDEAWRIALRPSWAARLWNRRTLARASILTFPCERLGDYTLRATGRRSRVHVIPHIGAASTNSPAPAREFTIVHAGKLRSSGGGRRRANPIIWALARLLETNDLARSLIRLVFVGPQDPAVIDEVGEIGLSRVVSWTGEVGYDESLEYIARASVCLLVEGALDEGIFLPSKFSDYVAAGKPIIAMSPEKGTLNDISQDGGVMRVAPDDGNGVLKVLTTLFDAFLTERLAEYAPPKSLAKRYRPDTVAQQFLSALHAPRPG